MNTQTTRVGRYTSALSSHPVAAAALAEVIGSCLEQSLDPPSFSLICCSPIEPEQFLSLSRAASSLLDGSDVVTICSDSPIGVRQHVENGLGLGLMTFPDGPRAAVHLTPTGRGWAQIDEHLDLLQSVTRQGDVVVLMADPFSFDADNFTAAFNRRIPSCTLAGGYVSVRRKRARFFLAGKQYTSGAIALVLPGSQILGCGTSQGTQAVGQPYVVTSSDKNVIVELGSQRAVSRLEELINAHLKDRDLEILAQGGLQVGRVIDEYQENYSTGDFLVSNVLDIDQVAGTLTLSHPVSTGSTVQFHLRDPERARVDMEETLQLMNPTKVGCAAALIFAGNGRGISSFGDSHSDPEILAEVVGHVPTIGCSVTSNIGPVGGVNYLLSRSTSIVLLRK